MLRTLETGRVGVIGADLAINLDQSLGGDGGDLTAVQSVLQTVSEEDDEGKAFAKLMGTRGRAGSLDSEKSITWLSKKIKLKIVWGSADARRYRSVCRASMMKELRDASSAFWVHGPVSFEQIDNSERWREITTRKHQISIGLESEIISGILGYRPRCSCVNLLKSIER